MSKYNVRRNVRIRRNIFERPITTNLLEVIIVVLCAFFFGAIITGAMYHEVFKLQNKREVPNVVSRP